MPPLVRAPGQRSLISGSASMNAFAYSSCSSIPVATASTFGSKMMSSGGKPSRDEQVVRAPADLDLALDRVRLPLLVERHHDDAGAVAADAARLLEERLLALLERDRVDDALALEALQARLEHRPARAVDHDRQPRDLRLGRDVVEERRHRLLALEQVGVHVHVEDVRAAAHLLERDVDGAGEVAGLDEPPEARRAGDVRALADHHEARVRPDLERLEPAEARMARGAATTRGDRPSDGGDDRPDVVGRRAAAAADDVHEPVAGELAQVAARVRRLLVVEPQLVREAGVRVARDLGRRDARERSSTNGRISFAPSEQLTPTMNGFACSTDDQNASTVWPERLRPLRSIGRERDPERELRAPPPAPRRSRPWRSACRRSSRSAGRRRRPRRAPPSAPRTRRAPRRT